jgi:hypothetical protein
VSRSSIRTSRSLCTRAPCAALRSVVVSSMLAVGCAAGAGIAASVLVIGCGSDSAIIGRDAGGAAVDGGGWSAPPACGGREIGTAGVLDLDIALVTIEGTITVDGRALDASEAALAAIDLRERDTGEVLTLASPSLHGDGSYRIVVPPGRYDLAYRGLTTCEAAPRLPCNGGLVHRDVALDASGVLDLALTTARVEANVTIASGRSAERGQLALGSAMPGVGSARAPIRGGAAAIRVLRGEYEIAYEHDGCDGPEPCGRFALPGRISVSTDGLVDLVVPSVEVSGIARLDGAPAPSGLRVALAQSGGGSAAVETRGGAYAATIVPGTYDLGVDAPAARCEADGPLPCVPAILRRGISLRSDGVIDLDGDLVRVDGAVRIDGAVVDVGAARIRVIGEDGEGTATELDGTWGATVIAGTYAIHYDGDASACTGRAAPVAPCNAGPVVAPRRIANDGVLDLDLRAVRISGAITGAVPGSESPSLRFTAAGGAGDLRLPISGGAYAVTLLAGLYAVHWSDVAEGCAQGSSGGRSDCLETEIQPAVELAVDGVLDLTIRAFDVEGLVTITPRGGSSTPVASGALRFTSADRRSHARASITSGAYRLPLAAARYTVTYEHAEALCRAASGPCGAVLAGGCPSLGRP